MRYLFHLFSLQVYQRARIHDSSSLHAVAPSFLCCLQGDACIHAMSRGNWSLCTATPSTQEKKWKGFLFPNFFLKEWGGYSVARKTASFFFFTIKINFKAPCKCCPRLLPTSQAQMFSRARSPRDRFFTFSAEKASERARALGPTTGTGNEKRKTLRKSNDAPANYWSIDPFHKGSWILIIPSFIIPLSSKSDACQFSPHIINT